MKLFIYTLSILSLLFCKVLFGQSPERDPIEAHVFPPELVMQHQQILSLSAEQKSTLKKEIRSAQSKFTDLQWDLEDEMETFLSLLSQERIDEQQAITQLGKVLELETQIKRTHLTLAIRIKNVLTPEQQAKLQEIKKKSRQPGMTR
ncbi:MAG: Spy/CpxP family protein refolding chaperone [bacterium]